jgi:hypothetical protein
MLAGRHSQTALRELIQHGFRGHFRTCPDYALSTQWTALRALGVYLRSTAATVRRGNRALVPFGARKYEFATMTDLPHDPAERALALQEMLVNHATGGSESDPDYQKLRGEFMTRADTTSFTQRLPSILLDRWRRF